MGWGGGLRLRDSLVYDRVRAKIRGVNLPEITPLICLWKGGFCVGLGGILLGT